SEHEAETHVDVVVFLAVVAKVAAVAEPTVDGGRQLRRYAEFSRAPALVRHEAGQFERAVHAVQAGTDQAPIGLAVVVPGQRRIRRHHHVAGLPVALEVPAQGRHQRVTLLATEPHGRAVVAIFAVAADLDRVPFDGGKRSGAQGTEVEPPAAGQAGAEVRTVGLAGLGEPRRTDVEAALDVLEVRLPDVRVAADVAAALVPGQVAEGADVLHLVAATGAGDVGGVLADTQRDASGQVVGGTHVRAQREI